MDILLQNLATLAKDKKLNHAVLLEGNFDKTLQASIFLAQSLKCDKDLPCDSCASCKAVKNQNHEDVHFFNLDTESNELTVDKVREIRSMTSYKPIVSNENIFILLQADKMLKPAQNALLKVLEEPADNTLFILGAKTAQKLLETVLSRLSRYSLTAEEDKEESFSDLSKEFLSLLKKRDYKEVMLKSALFPKTRAELVSLLGSLRNQVALNIKNSQNADDKLDFEFKLHDKLNELISFYNYNANVNAMSADIVLSLLEI